MNKNTQIIIGVVGLGIVGYLYIQDKKKKEKAAADAAASAANAKKTADELAHQKQVSDDLKNHTEKLKSVVDNLFVDKAYKDLFILTSESPDTIKRLNATVDSGIMSNEELQSISDYIKDLKGDYVGTKSIGELKVDFDDILIKYIPESETAIRTNNNLKNQLKISDGVQPLKRRDARIKEFQDTLSPYLSVIRKYNDSGQLFKIKFDYTNVLQKPF